MKKLLWPCLVIFASCSKNREDTTKPMVQNITESVYASGVVKSRNQYEVFSPVNGIVAQRRVAEGDIVHKGEVIITLLNETPALNSENAQLAAAYSSVSLNSDRLQEMRVNIDLARAKKQNDSLLFARQQNLWKNEIGTRNELEQRELAWKNASKSYQAAVLQYNNLKRSIDYGAQQSQTNLQISNSLKQDYNIKARQDGRVYRILKEPGEMVNTQTPIAIIGGTDDFIIELQVDEYDIRKIKPSQKIFISLDSYKGEAFEGTVTTIQPIMDDRSRSFKVEASFTSPPPHLYPNLTVEANILISTKKNALTVPRNYLIDESYVLLKNGEKRKVVTGLKDYQRVEIISGLGKDDLVKQPAK